ncbi:MAG: 3-hydroxylacyl-ACP dehydratase [Methylococcaceae bacterium]|nr:3-hydroxylacyl-ACP dehydratase [Methylococcaceae bacterium]
MTFFKDYQLAELLPHSGQMIWLDRVVDFDQSGLSAELVVRDDGLLGHHASVPASIGIEYMAQAIAAYSGIKDKLAGQPIRPGYLLGTRRYNSNVGEFAVNTRLTVRVEKIAQDEQLGIFDCRILGENIEITARLNVYNPISPIIVIDE